MSGGFVAARHLNGRNTFITQRYQKSTSGQDASLVYVGDPMKLNADGTTQRLMAADVSASGNSGFLGVAAGVYTNEAGHPKTHSLPTNHPDISNTADADWIDVYVDPDIIYVVNADVSAAQSLIGQAVSIKTTTRSTAVGQSGSRLDTSVSASSANPFKIFGIARSELATRLGSAGGLVEVLPNYSVFKTGASF